MRLTSITQISHRLDDADSVIRALEAIGLPVPKAPGGSGVSAEIRLAALAVARIGFSEGQVDEALDKTELPPSDRIALKLTMRRHQLLRKAA